MTNNGVVKIQGKDYMTVAGRVDLAHKSGRLTTIETEVIQHTPVVVVKACVYVKSENGDKQTQMFTGISAANPAKSIEKMSPYEVAETSAVGRALGFAGFGSTDSIATADEMAKAGVDADGIPMPTDEDMPEQASEEAPAADPTFCSKHNKPMKQRTAQNGGHYYDHRWNEAGVWYRCNGEEVRKS